MQLHKHFRTSILVAFTITSFGVSISAQSLIPTCQSFEGKSLESARAYLEKDRATLEPACINEAITILKRDTQPSTKRLLLRYIDFKMELPRRAPRSVTVGPTGGEYPAADTLAFFRDDDVIPNLKKIIGNDNRNKQSRLNAADVYFWFDNKPSTIAFVAEAAEEAADRDAGSELARQAASMVKYCLKDQQDECQKALDNPATYMK